MDTIPEFVKEEIKLSISWLKFARNTLENARQTDAMFGGQGRYEAEVLENRFGGLEHFLATRDAKYANIAKFEQRANELGIQEQKDMALFLNQAGYPELEDLSISQAAAEYFGN